MAIEPATGSIEMLCAMPSADGASAISAPPLFASDTPFNWPAAKSAELPKRSEKVAEPSPASVSRQFCVDSGPVVFVISNGAAELSPKLIFQILSTPLALLETCITPEESTDTAACASPTKPSGLPAASENTCRYN